MFHPPGIEHVVTLDRSQDASILLMRRQVRPRPGCPPPWVYLKRCPFAIQPDTHDSQWIRVTTVYLTERKSLVRCMASDPTDEHLM